MTEMAENGGQAENGKKRLKKGFALFASITNYFPQSILFCWWCLDSHQQDFHMLINQIAYLNTINDEILDSSPFRGNLVVDVFLLFLFHSFRISVIVYSH